MVHGSLQRKMKALPICCLIPALRDILSGRRPGLPALRHNKQVREHE